jgi:hypothetical protein
MSDFDYAYVTGGGKMTSSHRTVPLIVLTGIAMVAISFLQIRPAAGDAEHRRQSYPFEFLIPAGEGVFICPLSEDVRFSGRVQFVETISHNQRVSYHRSLQALAQMNGVGLTSGDRYILRSKTNDVVVYRDPGGGLSTGGFHLIIVRQGSGPIETFHAISNFTVDEITGEVTVRMEKEDGACHDS